MRRIKTHCTKEVGHVDSTKKRSQMREEALRKMLGEVRAKQRVPNAKEGPLDTNARGSYSFTWNSSPGLNPTTNSPFAGKKVAAKGRAEPSLPF